MKVSKIPMFLIGMVLSMLLCTVVSAQTLPPNFWIGLRYEAGLQWVEVRNGQVLDHDTIKSSLNLDMSVEQTPVYSRELLERGIVEVRGQKYDIHGIHVGDQRYHWTSIEVWIPRAGSSQIAQVEDVDVPLPATIFQWWQKTGGDKSGSLNGFGYGVWGANGNYKYVGASNDSSRLGGQTSGILRIDGNAYVIPEFAERQPRAVYATQNWIILQLYAGNQVDSNNGVRNNAMFRPGEAFGDGFAILDSSKYNFNDCIRGTSPRPESEFYNPCAACIDAEQVPVLFEDSNSPIGVSSRQQFRSWFRTAKDGMTSSDPFGRVILERGYRMQGVSWEKRFADSMPGQQYAGELDSTFTTLFSNMGRGGDHPNNTPGVFGWREHGCTTWGNGFTALHYDWLFAAYKYYLRTGNLNALRWALYATRHATTVETIFPSRATPYKPGPGGGGRIRFESDNHGYDANGNEVAVDDAGRPSHAWAEGFALAQFMSNKQWTWRAYMNVAWGTMITDWQVCGETRTLSNSIRILMSAAADSGYDPFAQRALQLMEQYLAEERAAGGNGGPRGYLINSCGYGSNAGMSQSIMVAYPVVPFIFLYEQCQIRGRGEWKPEYTQAMVRMGIWASTRVDQGGMFYPASSGPFAVLGLPSSMQTGKPFSAHPFLICTPTSTSCANPTTPPYSGEIAYYQAPMFADLFTWLAQHDPDVSKRPHWRELSKQLAYEAVTNFDPQGLFGYNNRSWPGAQSKVLGWDQIAFDRTMQFWGGEDTRFDNVQEAEVFTPELSNQFDSWYGNKSQINVQAQSEVSGPGDIKPRANHPLVIKRRTLRDYRRPGSRQIR